MCTRKIVLLIRQQKILNSLKFFKVSTMHILITFRKELLFVRGRPAWYEKGEKNKKYFLRFESYKNAKSCILKVFTKKGTLSSDPKTDLYGLESNLPEFAHSFLQHSEIPKLSLDRTATCEGKLTVEECFKSLQSLENKSPGSDGLTLEFYKSFWGVVGNLLVESLNCAFDYGELSYSQKQAIITLKEKKGKDRRYISNWRPNSL